MVRVNSTGGRIFSYFRRYLPKQLYMFHSCEFDVNNKKILEGYREYFERSIDKDDADRDPNVFESYQKDGIWYLYSSLEAFDDEMNAQEKQSGPIPRKELVREHWKRHPNIG